MSYRDRLGVFRRRAGTPKFIRTCTEVPVIDENGRFILDFLNNVTKINNKFELLELKMSEVLRVQSDILAFSHTDAGLHPLYDNIRRAINELVDDIKDMKSLFDQEKFTGSETELSIYNTQTMCMKRRIACLIARYYSIQEEYKDKCKTRVLRQAAIAGADVSNFEEAVGTNTDIFMHTVFPDFDMTHHFLNEIKKRHEDFRKLERSIAELHDLMFDFALVIQTDFALLDRIDKHSTFVDKLVVEAFKDVKSYRRQIRTSRFKRFVTIGCIVFVVAIIIMIILFMLRNIIF